MVSRQLKIDRGLTYHKMNLFLRSFFFRSVTHAEVIIENDDSQTNADNSKRLVYLDSVNCM